MDVQHMATVVHLWLERRTVERCGYESLVVAGLLKVTKFRQNRELSGDIVSCQFD
jgi:hypothetical protein